MPSVGPHHTIDVYTSASSLPSSVWETFRTNPCDSNIMFPHAEKCREQERDGNAQNSLWMTCTTSEAFATSTIDFVLSCTEGPLGAYPVFIFTTLPIHLHNSDYSYHRLRSLVQHLSRKVPSDRVFSIFAPECITRAFASLWTRQTGIALDTEPEYYAAKISYCTRESFRPRRKSLLPGVEYGLRLATEADIPRCAELCYGFAKESVRLDPANTKCLSIKRHPTGTICPH